MCMNRRKLKEEITKLKYRIADLEERLCPCEDHDWAQIGYYYDSSMDGSDTDTVYKYKCRRCGKTCESYYN